MRMCPWPAACGAITGLGWLMNAANDETRMATSGSGACPHRTSLTSAPQLVTPSWTGRPGGCAITGRALGPGPPGVGAITGAPLSPGHRIVNGAAWWTWSAVQSIVAEIEFG